MTQLTVELSAGVMMVFIDAGIVGHLAKFRELTCISPGGRPVSLLTFSQEIQLFLNYYNPVSGVHLCNLPFCDYV